MGEIVDKTYYTLTDILVRSTVQFRYAEWPKELNHGFYLDFMPLHSALSIWQPLMLLLILSVYVFTVPHISGITRCLL